MAKKWDKSVQKSEKKGEKVTKRPKVSKSAPKKWDKNVQKSEKKAKGKVTKSDQNGQKSDKKVQKKGEKMSKKKK